MISSAAVVQLAKNQKTITSQCFNYILSCRPSFNTTRSSFNKYYAHMKNVFVSPNIKYKYINIYIVWNTYFGFLIYCLKHSGWHRPLHKSASTSTTPVPLWSTAPWGVHQLLLEVCNVHQLWPRQNPIQWVPLTITVDTEM